MTKKELKELINLLDRLSSEELNYATDDIENNYIIEVIKIIDEIIKEKELN